MDASIPPARCRRSSAFPAGPASASSADREPLLRDVSTLQEAGLKDFEMTVWSATFVPARTPKDTVAKVSELLRTALADPAVRQEPPTPAAAAADRCPTSCTRS
ncbi:tripartite tricarboxylate transporter substrate-binding protein [Cupriavidus sp. 8B]